MPTSIYDEPANLLLPSTSNPAPEDIAAEEERKKRELALKKQADLAKRTEVNKARGLDPNGRKLKAKDRQAQLTVPKPRKLIPDNSVQNNITANPVTWVRAALRNDNNEGGWAVVKEPLRVVEQSFTRAVEGVGEAAIWGSLAAYSAAERAANKVLKLPLPALPKTWDPLEKEYREILFNSTSDANKPVTYVGKEAANIGAFALTTFQIAAKLPQIGLLGKVAGRGKLVRMAAHGVTGLPAAAAADFLLTKAGDPNFANMVRDLPFVSPETEDIWSLGLASNRTDNAFISKIKASISGGTVGTFADSLAYLVFARKATQLLLRQGIPEDEALTRGVAAGAEAAKEVKSGKTALAEKQWPEAEAGRIRELEIKRIDLETELETLKYKQLELPLNENAPATKAPDQVDPGAAQISPELQDAEKRLASARTSLKEIEDGDAYWSPEYEKAKAEVDAITKEVEANTPPPRQLELNLNKAEADVDPEVKRIQEIQKQLDDINDEKTQIEMDMGTPKEQLRPEDQATFDESTNPNNAAANQIRLETSVPKIARRPDADPSILKGATSPTMGHSPQVFTDAFYKIISTSENVGKETLKVLRKVTSEMDLTFISKAAGRPISEVLSDAASFIDAFREADKLAGEAVATGDDFLEVLRNQKLTKTVTDNGDSKELLNAVGIVAAKTIITDTANQIYTLARSLDELYAAGRNPGNQIDRLVDRLVTMSELHKLTGADSGYNLRMFQEMLGGKTGRVAPEMSPSAAKAQHTKFLKNWAEKIKRLSRAGQDADAQEELQALVKVLVLNGGDPAGTMRQFSLLARSGAQLALNNIYNSILSGPISHLRNIAGNTYSLIERPLSLGITGVFAKDPAARYAAVAAYRGVMDSYSDAFKVMRVSFQTGEPLQINRRFVLQEAEAKASLEALRLTTEPIKEGMEPRAYARALAEHMALGVVDTLYKTQNNPLFNWSSRSLVAADDFFKIINSRMKISMDAAYAAHSSKLSPKDLEARYGEIYAQKFSSSFHNDLQIKDEALLDWTDASTLQDNPGGFVNSLSRLLEEAPILRLAMPFVRTPYNLMVYGAQHFPLLNLASSRARKVLDSMPGDEGFDPVAKATMQGRQAIGATFAGAAFMGALHGNIRGNGPPPGPARDLWLKEGPPRSIKVVDKWVSYESIEPINNFMALASDIAMLARMGHQSTAEKLGQQLSFAFAISIVDKSYLSGLTVVAGFLDRKTYTSPDPITKGLLSTANSLIPQAGMRRFMSNTLNPHLREIDGELNKVMAVALPGFALNNPTKIDPFTNKPFNSLSGGWYNATSPFRIYDASFPEGTDEALGQSVALRLSEADWDSSALTTRYDQGEEIEADERADFSEALYKVRLAPRLDVLFKSDGYKQALAAYKNRSTGIKNDESEHTRMINETIRDAKREARSLMFNTSEKWRTRNDLVRKRKYQGGRGDIKGAIQTNKAIEALKDGN